MPSRGAKTGDRTTLPAGSGAGGVAGARASCPAMPPKCGRRARLVPAFSLVELTLVLVIVGVAASIAVPRFAAAQANFRAQSAGRQVQALLTLAQTQARASSSNRTLRFDLSASTVQLLDSNGAVLQQLLLGAEPHLCTLAEADFGGSSQVVFDGFGAPSAGGRVIVRNAEASVTIDLEAQTGRTTMP